MSVNSARISETIGHIAARWQEVDKSSLRHVFPLLAEGRPVSPTRLAQLTGKDIATLERAFQRGHTDRDLQGHVTELFGIMLSPTLHRIQVGRVVLFSCCALISHLFPSLIGRIATVESVDPVTHRLVQLTISPGGLQSVKPKGAVATLVVTQGEDVLKDVRTAFCSHVCHFISSASAARFVSRDPRRYVVGIEDFHQTAKQLRAMIWGMEATG